MNYIGQAGESPSPSRSSLLAATSTDMTPTMLASSTSDTSTALLISTLDFVTDVPTSTIQSGVESTWIPPNSDDSIMSTLYISAEPSTNLPSMSNAATEEGTLLSFASYLQCVLHFVEAVSTTDVESTVISTSDTFTQLSMTFSRVHGLMSSILF